MIENTWFWWWRDARCNCSLTEDAAPTLAHIVKESPRLGADPT